MRADGSGPVAWALIVTVAVWGTVYLIGGGPTPMPYKSDTTCHCQKDQSRVTPGDVK